MSILEDILTEAYNKKADNKISLCHLSIDTAFEDMVGPKNPDLDDCEDLDEFILARICRDLEPFSNRLREIGIRSFWMTAGAAVQEPSKVSEHPRVIKPRDNKKRLIPHEEDITLFKCEQDGFIEYDGRDKSHNYEFFVGQGMGSFITSGVNASCCYGDSVVGLFRNAVRDESPIKVIVAHDLVNENDYSSTEELINDIRKRVLAFSNRDPVQERDLIHAHSNEILNVLEAIAA